MMAGQRAEGGVPAVGAGLAVDAAAEGFVYAAVDAAATRAHLADQLFFAVAGQVDWAALASRAVRAAYGATAFPVPDPPGDLTVAAVAAHHEVDARELYRSVRRALEHALLGATGLAHEFRLAMLRLCQAELGVGEVDVAERDAVLGWLKGERVALALLRRSLIYGRIGRHSAQAMLTSLASWLPRVGHGGLVLDIDLARLAVGRRPPVEQREGVYYSKAAVLDAYEVLRQLIDATDVLSAALGSAQTEIEDRFAGLLEQAGDRPAGARHPAGLLLGGGFGSGKSHLLEHLAQLALDAGFVVGRVVVSKETPLYDPVKVFRAAAASAVVPGGHGPALVEAAASLDPGTPAHSDLWRWVSAQGAGLNERFAATLLLFDRLGATDGELADAIVRFWSGDPIKVAEVRRRLRETGEARYPLPAVPARELARQRFRFATRLMVAAGYSGWLVLFDEVELIGRYSVLQRGRSYAELARWVRGAHDDPGL